VKVAPFVALAVAFVAAGCGTTAKFVYPANNTALVRIAESPATGKKVAVPPFDDQRGDANQAGTMFLYMVPLMPFGWVDYDRPDAGRMFLSIVEFEFTPSEDLSKAAAYSLRRSGLFADAFFTFGGERDKADFVLEGQVQSTRYKGSIWSYGTSVFCPLLWFVGLPAGQSDNRLTLALQLRDARTRSIVWEKDYDLDRTITQGLYYKMGHDIRGYAYLMQQVMNDAVVGMDVALRATGTTGAPGPAITNP
jgi:hypothetical protein